MPSSSSLLTLATVVSAVNAAYQGFNYGSTFTSGQPKAQTDFEAEFKTAAGLDGTNGAFTSARLYTMIQGGTTNAPISAIPAAISTKTSLLFGLWASAGDAAFANEIAALKSAISQYCGQMDGLVAGISVGSEDLYRITPTGVASHAGPGAQPGTLVNYINQVRDTIKGTCLAKVPIGHVDTWNAWVVGSNKPVIDAVDWLGMDTYPYYENTNSNGIANAKALYEAALQKIQNAGPGKEVWVTETGWPVNGKSSGDAVASVSNAQKYWQEVGCPNFGKTNVWWYTLQDAEPSAPNPSFGLIGSSLTEKPLFDLSCANTTGSEPQTTGSSGSQTTGSESQTTGGAGGAGGAPASSTFASVPFPTANSTSSSGGSPTGSGSSSSPSASTTAPGSSGNKLSSFGAAAAAVAVAAIAL
ncbi:glycoside hydrolase family 17 protein [Trichoderma asperellum CBS 433.97]|uniref:Probable glucan endo-1,3-beta-glucosidase eglC n=1 Tax=Trichoderma asperellum (strain ATCC 204424 / CBS 433.97 / NBRC 101777) TaxID=1042311 RepID=A0A2T3ZLZ4_TRIA4|nr:glycoside hydrolase family 17 protein [Trichoderma asperellum CBS 433.97]PTB45825.1 glycoside hydrolase family 17 protein [Trichoderma asperellum CBS 433.97]